MTELIQYQLKIIGVMCYCGLAAGLIMDIFRLFIKRFFSHNKIMSVIMKALCCIVIAFLIGDFSFYCQNGKLTFLGTGVFFAGLWLWRKVFYGIIVTGEKDEQKREETQGV